MSEIVKKRRRWPWAVLAAVLFLVVGPIAWQFRPLNATERQLVGRWGHDPDHVIWHFHADRHATGLGFRGTWSASPDTVTLRRYPFDTQREELKNRLIMCFRRLRYPVRNGLEFEGPDRIVIGKFHIKRLPD